MDCGVAAQLLAQAVGGEPGRDGSELLAGAAKGATPLLAGGPRNPAVRDDPLAVTHGLYGYFAAASQRRPLALLVDDAHLADEASLRFLLYLAERLQRLPLAVVVAGRPVWTNGQSELLAELVRHPSAKSSPCLPLSEDAVASCVRESLSLDAEDAFCGACVDVSGGNPSLLRELVGELRAYDGKPLDERAEAALAAGPKPVADGVEHSLRLLGEGTLELARATAVAGSDSQLRHCAAVAGLDELTAARAADLLIEEGILRLSDRLEFLHPIVERALYLHHPPAGRGGSHLRLAGLLAAERAEAERVAGHLLRSPCMGNRWVGDALWSAASATLMRGDPQTAIEYLRRALKEPAAAQSRPGIILALGRAEAVAGEPGAVEHLRQAAQLLEDPHKR